MTEHDNASQNKGQGKDNDLSRLDKAFDEGKFMKGLKTDAQRCIQQGETAQDAKENPFPVDALPEALQKIIADTHQNLKFPIDFIGASLLGATSVAIGNSYKAQLKSTFQANAVLFLAIVAPPGSNKSHPLNFALDPIRRHDEKAYADYEREKMKYDRVMKSRQNDDETDERPKPVLRKILFQDYTPEALASSHKFNKRGIGVYAEEFAGWFKNFDKYKAKGSEQEFWLSTWSGFAISVDRKTSDPLYISMPYIPVIGTMTPGTLYELARHNRDKNGFIDRILFVMPNGIKKEYWSRTDINPETERCWYDLINKLLSLPVQIDDEFNPVPKVLQFTEEAENHLYEWQKTNTDESNECDDDAIGGIIKKMDVYVLRFSLILELLRWACGESDKQAIGIESVQGAVKLCDYFKRSANRVHSIVTNANPLEKYPMDKQNLFETLPGTFTTEEGKLIADNLGIKERTYKRFLKERDLFTRISRGEYEKRI
jgi:hypothetical protein